MFTSIRSLPLLLAASLLATAQVLAAEEIRLSRPLAWTTAFAEEEVTITWKIAADPAVKGKLLWTLATGEKLVIDRGEVTCDGAAEIDLKLQLPNVKPGTVFDTLLTARLYRDGEREPVAHDETPLRLFPRDPFFDRREALKQRTIKLFDPEGGTAKLLASIDFPLEQIFNVSAIGEINSGLLLIGEGTSFREERALSELLLHAVARGVQVLCLAPSAGELELPRPGDEAANSISLTLERTGFMSRLDKRLDDKFWQQTPVAARHSLLTSGRTAQLIVEVDAGDAGWRWLELQVTPKVDASLPAADALPSKLVVLSLPLIANWESGPSPRFMFARLLDYIAPSSHLIPEKTVAP